MPGPCDWTVKIEPGAITRSVMWGRLEVALINPRGDFDDETEKDLAAGIAHAAKMASLLKRVAMHLRDLPSDVAADVAAVLRSVDNIDVGVMVEPE